MKDLQKRIAEHKRMMDEYKKTPEFRIEQVKFEIANEMCKFMEANEISRTEFAEKLGTSKAYVTKMLRGNCNFTLESLDKISHIMGCDLRIKFCPHGFKIPHLFIKTQNNDEDVTFDSLKNTLDLYFSPDLKDLTLEEQNDESSNAA